MLKYIEKIIKPIAKTIPAGKRGCLIMDSVSFHRNEEILNSISALGFDVALLPPGSTSDLQPLDLSKMKPFKDYYTELWQEWFENVGIKSLTANAGNYVAVSAEKFLQLIGKAWARVDESAAAAGFLIYDPELPMPFTDDLGPVFDEEQELTNEGIVEMKGLVYNPWL